MVLVSSCVPVVLFCDTTLHYIQARAERERGDWMSAVKDDENRMRKRERVEKEQTQIHFQLPQKTQKKKVTLKFYEKKHK